MKTIQASRQSIMPIRHEQDLVRIHPNEGMIGVINLKNLQKVGYYLDRTVATLTDLTV